MCLKYAVHIPSTCNSKSNCFQFDLVCAPAQHSSEGMDSHDVHSVVTYVDDTSSDRAHGYDLIDSSQQAKQNRENVVPVVATGRSLAKDSTQQLSVLPLGPPVAKR
eukprot:SAG31_NODE_2841_length_5015_cov_1.524817_4_plen_106_part_00